MEQPLAGMEDVEPVRKRRRKRRRRCKRHPEEGPHSPTCRGHKQTSPALVRSLPSLQPVLDFLKVKDVIFTRAQIMGHLTEYIKRKALYDPLDPRKVYCENDPLEHIFGCKEFSTANACELLLQNLESVPLATRKALKGQQNSISTTDSCSCSESDQQSTKSYSSDISSRATISGVKRNYNEAFSVKVSQQAPPSGSSTICSEPSTSSQCISAGNLQFSMEYLRHYKDICQNATDVVTDTSDDLFFLNETDEELVVRQFDDDKDRFVEEYEPVTYSEEERLVLAYGFSEDESGSPDTEVDEGEDGGDELGNGDSSDSEIEEEDKWQCDVCAERNHPMTSRCRRCWILRKGWTLPSLQRTSSDPSQSRIKIAAPVDAATVSDTALTSRSRLPLADVACTSQARVPSVDVVSDSQTASETCDEYGARVKCMLCRKEPPTGCMVHGSTGHQVCCVACAQKLKDSNRPCPVCRKRIRKVIKNFL